MDIVALAFGKKLRGALVSSCFDARRQVERAHLRSIQHSTSQPFFVLELAMGKSFMAYTSGLGIQGQHVHVLPFLPGTSGKEFRLSQCCHSALWWLPYVGSQLFP